MFIQMVLFIHLLLYFYICKTLLAEVMFTVPLQCRYNAILYIRSASRAENHTGSDALTSEEVRLLMLFLVFCQFSQVVRRN